MVDPTRYVHKVPAIAKLLPKPDGRGAPGNAIRGWCRRGYIENFRQRNKNAQIYLNAYGVREAWLNWADHKGLDPDTDIPEGIRDIIGVIDEDHVVTPPAGGDERPTVRIEVPPGVAVEVIYKAA